MTFIARYDIATRMDENRLEAVTTRCVTCTQPLKVYDRVVGSYRAGALFSMHAGAEVGLFLGHDLRPYFSHVQCSDPTLKKYKMRPDIQYCIRCRAALSNNDMVCPVFGVTDAKAVSPTDPTDKGITLGERIYFAHLDCKRPDLTTGGGLLVL